MRVGVIGLMHESNTFAAGPTPLASFARDVLIEGLAVAAHYADSHHELGGFFEQLAAEGLEAVPLFAAWTMPSGAIAAAAATELADRVVAAVRAALPLDGLLVAPHGAAVAEGEPDFDGYWLSRVRIAVGPGVPLIGTLDLHGNLSPRMVAATDALFAYRTNPHLDQRQTGRAAAALLARTLRGEVRPTAAGAFPPLVANIESQGTAESPCLELYAFADEVRRRPGVLAVSLLLGFPYADVPEMGVGVTVVTDNDSPLAQRYADEIASWWWGHREEFRGDLVPLDEAVRRAATAPGPVCLLDMGDNVGGGSPADSTLVAHELLRQGIGPAFVCLADPQAVAAATRAGVGGTLALAVGGKTDDRHGRPIAGPFRVVGLYDGVFEEAEARHGGLRHYDQGPTAVVEAGGLTVMLTTLRMPPSSLSQVTTFGLDPAKFRVLVAKGVHAPRAAYAPVCPTLIRVNTAGVTTADLSRFDYRHRRRPLFSFEPDATWTPDPEGRPA